MNAEFFLGYTKLLSDSILKLEYVNLVSESSQFIIKITSLVNT